MILLQEVTLCQQQFEGGPRVLQRSRLQRQILGQWGYLKILGVLEVLEVGQEGLKVGHCRQHQSAGPEGKPSAWERKLPAQGLRTTTSQRLLVAPMELLLAQQS